MPGWLLRKRQRREEGDREPAGDEREADRRVVRPVADVGVEAAELAARALGQLLPGQAGVGAASTPRRPARRSARHPGGGAPPDGPRAGRRAPRRGTGRGGRRRPGTAPAGAATRRRARGRGRRGRAPGSACSGSASNTSQRRRGASARQGLDGRERDAQQHRLEAGDAPAAGDRPRGSREVGLGDRRAFEQSLGVADEDERRISEPYAAPRPLEQRHARLALEHGELLGDRRGGELERVGDRGDRPPLAQLAQEPQAAQVEHREETLPNRHQKPESFVTLPTISMPGHEHTGHGDGRPGGHDDGRGGVCLASAASFGAMGIFGRLAYDDGATVGTLLAVRFALAAALFWALVVASGGAAELRRSAGATSSPASPWAAGSTPPRRAGTSPRSSASTLRCSRCWSTRSPRSWRRGDRPRPRACRPPPAAALGIVSAGLVLVLASSGAGSGDPLGSALGLATAVVYSVYILAGEGIARRVPPLVLSALVCTGAAVSLTAGSALLGELRPGGLTLSGWAWIACIAVVCTVVALSLFFAGLRRVGPDDRLDPLYRRAGRDRGARLRHVRRRAGSRPAARRLRGARRRARASGADAHRVAGEAAPLADRATAPPGRRRRRRPGASAGGRSRSGSSRSPQRQLVRLGVVPPPAGPRRGRRLLDRRGGDRHAPRMNVTVWDENVHERNETTCARSTPTASTARCPRALADVGTVRTATLERSPSTASRRRCSTTPTC